MLFWMLALCLSASVSLHSHKTWCPDTTERALVDIFLVYDVSVRNLEITTSSFNFFRSSFHSISFFLFFILFSLFCHLVFLVFLSSVLIQLIRSCGGYFSVAKRSSSRAAFASLRFHFLVFPYGLALREG
jgi:hypothetical protein